MKNCAKDMNPLISFTQLSTLSRKSSYRLYFGQFFVCFPYIYNDKKSMKKRKKRAIHDPPDVSEMEHLGLQKSQIV